MRINSIDYLRGIMAVSVVLYHFNSWFLITPDSNKLLGKLGIYAVSSFYVISGMALYLTHKNDCWEVKESLKFILKRFLRLAPVYWVGMAALTIFCFTYYKGFEIDWYKYVENLTLSFGIINPSGYLLTGGWSVGNEVCFYILFPFLCIACRSKLSSVVLLILSIILLLYCSYYYISPHQSLVSQWLNYINPINQVYFFIFGVLSAKFLAPFSGRNKYIWLFVALAIALMFTWMPTEGNQINIVTGAHKIIFVTLTVSLCSAFFLVMDLKEFNFLHVILKFLGDISYPLYLTHGVAFLYFKKLVFDKGITHTELFFYGSLMLALLVLTSWICHILIERPVIRVSRRLSSPMNKKVIL